MKLTDFIDEAIELKPETFASVYNCVVLAPHPDDESLGCGGLIALLRSFDKEVNVIFITDGSLSHPNSKKYPAGALSALRKQEALQALAVLQVPCQKVFFLDKKDGALPARAEVGFAQNASRLHVLLSILNPDLVVAPYEKDTHRDHRATWQMLQFSEAVPTPKYWQLEYFIWLHERGSELDLPDKNSLRYVDITTWQKQKQEAIAKHVSQTTRLIDDDPQGFILSPEVLSHFSNNKELYFERSI